MRNKTIPAILVCALIIGLISLVGVFGSSDAFASDFTLFEPEPKLDERIVTIEDNIDAIMAQGSAEFFGHHPVTEEFFFWVARNYGEDVLMKLADNREFTDPKAWFMITGKSIHVLYQEYVSYVGLDAWDYSHVHTIENKGGDTTFVFSGDVTLHEGAATTNYMDGCANGIIDCFSPDLFEVMQDADVFVVNNEYCYSTRGEPTPGKTFTFRADPKRVQAMVDMGADLLCLANNHVFDYGEEALKDTLDTIEKAGLPYIGAGEDLNEARRIRYYISGGIKISIVNATQIERSATYTREATADQSGVFKTLDPANCIQTIQLAKKNSDLCIVVVHWGTEGSNWYGGDQVDLATKYVEAGADAIVGGHTHCLQGIEYIGEVPIFYSLGNYWFSTTANMPASYDTGLAVLEITQEGKIKPSFVPARFSGAVVTMLNEQEAERVYGYLESVSLTTTIDSKGNIRRR